MYREALLRSKRKKVCEHCGIADLRVLIAHHIDENRKNNSLENLAWVCHNCHFLIHHSEGEYLKFMVSVV